MTTAFPYATVPATPPDPKLTLNSATASLTLTTSPMPWAYPGSSPRTSPSRRKSLSLGCTGTSIRAVSQSRGISAIATWMRSRRGAKRQRMTSWRCSGCTANSCMRHSSSWKDKRTLPGWRPCWESSVTVLTSHVMHPTLCAPNSNGGKQSSRAPSSIAPYPAQPSSPTSAHTPTPAPKSELASSSEITGAHGGSFPGGRRWNATPNTPATLAGPRPWGLSSSFVHSSSLAPRTVPSRSMTTTTKWWKGGGTIAAKTHTSMVVFRRIHTILITPSLLIHSCYVPSRYNPTDRPSRAAYPPCHLLLPQCPIPTERRKLICDYDTQPLDSEIDLRRQHLDPVATP